MTGTLYGIGLGPGDPELLTLKAARLLGGLDVIAYPALPGSDSMARGIASGHLRDGVEDLRIDLPMTRDREPAQAAYDEGAARIAQVLRAGRNVGFLCEGDPLFFGSFMYVAARLSRDFAVETVPGITSVSAAAAAAGLALVARDEALTILPATLDQAELTRRLQDSQSAVVMKLGRHIDRVKAALEAAGFAGQATYVERASTDQQVVLPLHKAPSPAPYFSIILATKGSDPWARPRSS